MWNWSTKHVRSGLGALNMPGFGALNVSGLGEVNISDVELKH